MAKAKSLGFIWARLCQTIQHQLRDDMFGVWLCEEELLDAFKEKWNDLEELSLSLFSRAIAKATTSSKTELPDSDLLLYQHSCWVGKDANTKNRCRFFLLSKSEFKPSQPTSAAFWRSIRQKYEAKQQDDKDKDERGLPDGLNNKSKFLIQEEMVYCKKKYILLEDNNDKSSTDPATPEQPTTTTRVVSNRQSPRLKRKRRLEFEESLKREERKRNKNSSNKMTNYDVSMYQLKYSWRVAFPDQRFPEEYVVFNDRSKQQLNSHFIPSERKPSSSIDSKKEYNPTTHDVIAKKTLHELIKIKKYFNTLKKSVNYQRCIVKTDRTKRYLAALAAGHPHVSRDTMQSLIAAGRYSLLHDVASIANVETPWLSQELVAKSSPSGTAITQWVEELCVEEVILAREEMRDKVIFFQTDGGHAGQEVSLFTYFDDKTSSIREVWTGSAGVGGKTSKSIAQGIYERVKLFVPSGTIEGGLTCDSGQGTPESLLEAARKLDFIGPHGAADSCGLHDIQSTFRLPIMVFVGAGGLQNDTAIQLLHTLYSLHVEFKGIWTPLMTAVADRLGTEDAHELFGSMQAPLITRWWSIGVLASLFSKHKKVFVKTAKMIVQQHKTTEKAHVVASNFLRMCNCDWVVGDVFLVAGVINCCINKHMKWFQGADTNIGKPGFLSVHRLTRFFLMMEDVRSMEDMWETDERFRCYKELIESLTPTDQERKKDQRRFFFRAMEYQLKKHNKRLLKGIGLIRSAFGERGSSVVVAAFLQGVPCEEENSCYYSSIHKCTIDRQRLRRFLLKHVNKQDLQELKSNQRFLFHQQNKHFEAIVSGVDLWKDETENALLIRSMVMRFYSAQCSTQHNNERLINLASRSIGGGRSDTATNFLFVAACAYMPSSHEDEAEDNEEMTRISRKRRHNSRGVTKLVSICNRSDERLLQLNEVKNSMGDKVYKETLQFVRKQLNNTESIKKEKQKNLCNKIISNFDKDFKASKRMSNPQGVIVQPIVNGFVSYFKFFKTKFHKEIRSEFEARGLTELFDCIYNASNKKSYVSKLKEALKTDERKRLNAEFDKKLDSLGVEYTSKMTLKTKQTLIANNNPGGDNSVYSTDSNKYFKKISTSYDSLEVWLADGNIPD